MLVDRVQSFPAVTMKEGFELRVFEGTDYFVEVPDVSVADAAGSLRFVGVLHGFPASSAELRWRRTTYCGDYETCVETASVQVSLAARTEFSEASRAGLSNCR